MKNMEEKQVRGPHKLVINNRQTSLVTGVLDVLSFDLNEVLLETEQDADGKRNGSAREPPESGKRRSRSVGEY